MPIYLFCVLCLLLQSCRTPVDCQERTLDHIVVAFFAQASEEPQPPIPPEPPPDPQPPQGFHVFQDPPDPSEETPKRPMAPAFDSVIVLGKDLRRKFLFSPDEQQLQLPIDIDTIHTTYLMYKDEVAHRLQIRHYTQLIRPSESCGTRTQIVLERVEIHDFSEAEIKVPIPLPAHEVHMDITL